MRTSWILPLLAACTSPTHSGDIVGPFTGEVHRYIVDRFELPLSTKDARAFADDLDGDGTVDNQLGMLFGTLNSQMDLTTHSADMVASGALQTVIEIQADDLMNDPSVGVRYLGADGTPFTIIGGRLVNGVFTSNRTATTGAPGAATVVLPVFADADPTRIDALAIELSFAPEPDGSLDVRVNGGVDPIAARNAVAGGILQMVAADPQDHALLVKEFDTNHDARLTAGEISNGDLVRALLAPDVDLYEGTTFAPGRDGVWESLSFGFGLHVVPCASGTCSGAIADRCHDRVRDGDETDVDCGGSCGATCPGSAACVVANDCQSHTCNPAGCAPPSCTDGLRDGFESGVDCGYGCLGCAHDSCTLGSDCASGQCSFGACL